MENKYSIHTFNEVLTEFLGSLIGLAIFIIIALIVIAFGQIYTWLSLVFYLFFFIIIFAIRLIYRLIYLSLLRYETEDKNIVIRGGIISRFERTVPYSRIQHVVISRTFIQRWFGLSTVAIQDAGGEGSLQSITWNQRGNSQRIFANLVVPGLTKEEAESLKTEVLNKVLKSKSTSQGGI